MEVLKGAEDSELIWSIEISWNVKVYVISWSGSSESSQIVSWSVSTESSWIANLSVTTELSESVEAEVEVLKEVTSKLDEL